MDQPGTAKPVQVITLGCRLNAYESEVMRGHAQDFQHPHTIIINTCAVTGEAERQSRQTVRRARKDNPDAHIIVTGCSVQINPDVYTQMPEVNQVIGNGHKMEATSFDPLNAPRVLMNDIMEIKETAHHLVTDMEGHARAFIQIQNGCDHRCTFCTIPFGRGNNRSVPMGEIFHQVAHLVENGCQEIVLTGVDITGYGGDLPGTPTLSQMTKRLLAQNPSLKRLRLSSLDPAELDETFFELVQNEPRLLPHFHISLQAGADLILKRMKRRHLRHHIIEFCEKVRQLRPDAVFGADVIVGFPTETDAMFQDTLDLIEQCNITFVHVFPYSKRQGTPAARMPQVKGDVIKERATRLRTLGDHLKRTFLQNQVGKEFEVVIEASNRGHTPHFAPCQIDGDTGPLLGTIQKVKIKGATDNVLLAQLLKL